MHVNSIDEVQKIRITFIFRTATVNCKITKKNYSMVKYNIDNFIVEVIFVKLI